MRKRIFEIIEVSAGGDLCSSIYDAFMMVAIVASLVPLAFKTDYFAFQIIDKVCVGIFVIDYLLLLITAGYMSEIEKEKTPSDESMETGDNDPRNAG